jgi:hypothetical protein
MKAARYGLAVLCIFLASAVAQPLLRGEIAFSSNLLLSHAFPAQPSWLIAAHLEVEETRENVTYALVLDPRVSFEREVGLDPGLTELYGTLREDDFDVSVGLERLPLEYARLTLPFSLEPIDERGIRQGLPGARALWYLSDWRLRAALVWYEDALTPVVSARRGFGAFELEGHALYSGRLVFGLGGSGLVGDLVVYGESWLLLEPLEARGTLGLTGFLEDALWTLEAGYLPGLLPVPAPQVSGQLVLPQGDDASWNATAGLGLPEAGVVGQASLSYSRNLPDREVTISLAGRFGAAATTWVLNIGARGYF